MKTYDVKCPRCDKRFESIFTQPKCPECGSLMKRVWTPVGVRVPGGATRSR